MTHFRSTFLPTLRSTTLIGGILCAAALSAQINIGDKLERQAKQRLERKVDKTINKGFDKAEDGIDKGAREATKGKKGKGKEPGTEEQLPATGSTSNANATPAGKHTLKAYSKFDFIPGVQIIAVEDFQQDAIGDFPARWNTNSSAEVVTLDGYEGRWLRFGSDGVFYPEFLNKIPDNSTIEFDVITSDDFNYYCHFLTARFVDASSGNLLRTDHKNEVAVTIHPHNTGKEFGSTAVKVFGSDHSVIMHNDRKQAQFVHRGTAPRAHVAIWRQKNRIRVYLNEEKIWDLPRAFQNDVDYRLVLNAGSCDESVAYLGNIRVAEGAPDTRNKLITEGKLVTRGILFDSGSDRIKAESYGTLKDIATVLSENATVKVRIIGHTDSDGDDAANLELSKRRAAAVKEALSKEFNISAERMETDGKGEAQPAGPNDTPQAKANNRRVEFVKL